MERLSDKLLNILNEQDFCFTPEEMKMVKKAISRFTAYEKTGLGPEEVTELMAAHGTAILELSEYRQFGPKKHLQELAQAEKDGRLVVLPCKVGDTVYRVLTTRDNDPIITEIKIKNLGQAVDLIGRIVEKRMLVSWYLTREEAEAALKKREAGEIDTR